MEIAAQVGKYPVNLRFSRNLTSYFYVNCLFLPVSTQVFNEVWISKMLLLVSISKEDFLNYGKTANLLEFYLVMDYEFLTSVVII